MVAFEFLIPVILLTPTVLAGRIKYQVRMSKPEGGYTSTSRTLNMPDQHLDLISENMRTWSDQKFRAYISSSEANMVVVNNVNSFPLDTTVAEATISEMVVVVMCNVPAGGGGGAASIAGFDRKRQCKKRRHHK